MTTTIDGVPWREARPFGEIGPTYQEWNERALAPLSRRVGYCLCYHPFSELIDFTGCGCDVCGQQMTEQSTAPEARQLRTAATLEAFPELKKT